MLDNMGGIQFFIYEDTPTERTIIDEKEVSPYQVDDMRIVMETSVRILRQNSPNRVFGWYEYVIKNQPNQPGGTQFQ